MKRLIISISLLSIFFLSALGQDYYWSAGEKHFLTNAPNKFIVKPKSNITDTLVLQVATSINALKSGKLISSQNNLVVLKNSNLFNNVIPAKKLGETEIYFTGEILLQPKANVTISQIKALVNNEISVKSNTVHNTYVMDVNNWDSLFVYANRIYESGLVEYSHPNFIAPIERTIDPLYPSQWHLNNTSTGIDINAPEAWSIAVNQQPVRVAVIDDGVEAHEDLTTVLSGLIPNFP
jgi:hypothetical protein